MEVNCGSPSFSRTLWFLEAGEVGFPALSSKPRAHPPGSARVPPLPGGGDRGCEQVGRPAQHPQICLWSCSKLESQNVTGKGTATDCSERLTDRGPSPAAVALLQDTYTRILLGEQCIAFLS